MKCPVCPASELLLSVREGIEIDYCPQCRGIWLDRGELDQLIRRAEQALLAEGKTERDEWRREQERERGHRPLRSDHQRHDDHRYTDSRVKHEHPRRKKSFLGDLFDFD
jgi:Zn-finger nucleic acid-binding protein